MIRRDEVQVLRWLGLDIHKDQVPQAIEESYDIFKAWWDHLSRPGRPLGPTEWLMILSASGVYPPGREPEEPQEPSTPFLKPALAVEDDDG